MLIACLFTLGLLFCQLVFTLVPMTLAEIQQEVVSLPEDDRIALEEEKGEGKKKELKQISLLFADIEKAFVQVSFK